MNLNIKSSVLIIFFSILTIGVSGQNYKSAIGVRGGSLNGLTYKQFVTSNSAFEGILSSRWQGFQVTGLYQKHATAFGNEQFKWYYGAGGHVGLYDNYRNHPYFDDNDFRKDYVVVGIDGVLGLEFDIREIPFTVGVDWKPEFNIIGYTGFWFGDGGISIRYYW